MSLLRLFVLVAFAIMRVGGDFPSDMPTVPPGCTVWEDGSSECVGSLSTTVQPLDCVAVADSDLTIVLITGQICPVSYAQHYSKVLDTIECLDSDELDTVQIMVNGEQCNVGQ